MQFPVPQFTDVEDKIIAGLTFKQFAIVFGAAVFTFVIYTISKNVPVTIFVGIFTGLPALALTFGKLNGRPLYSSAGSFIGFLTGSKQYVYHKEPKKDEEIFVPVKTVEVVAPKNHMQTGVKIKELSSLLEREHGEEARLIELIKQKQPKE